MEQSDLDHALDVFGLSLPITREMLDRTYRELLQTWHPPRYANLTNNPRKYMQMYQKAEAMTKEIEAAYHLLSDWLASQRSPQS